MSDEIVEDICFSKEELISILSSSYEEKSLQIKCDECDTIVNNKEQKERFIITMVDKRLNNSYFENHTEYRIICEECIRKKDKEKIKIIIALSLSVLIILSYYVYKFRKL